MGKYLVPPTAQTTRAGVSISDTGTQLCMTVQCSPFNVWLHVPACECPSHSVSDKNPLFKSTPGDLALHINYMGALCCTCVSPSRERTNIPL